MLALHLFLSVARVLGLPADHGGYDTSQIWIAMNRHIVVTHVSGVYAIVYIASQYAVPRVSKCKKSMYLYTCTIASYKYMHKPYIIIVLHLPICV